MVDTIFADVAQPDQARIVAINAHHFLKNTGHVVISIKVRQLTPLNSVLNYLLINNVNMTERFKQLSLKPPSTRSAVVR